MVIPTPEYPIPSSILVGGVTSVTIVAIAVDEIPKPKPCITLNITSNTIPLLKMYPIVENAVIAIPNINIFFCQVCLITFLPIFL